MAAAVAQPLAPEPPRHRFRLPARYDVRAAVGTGSYGSVCEARDRERDRLVAIKQVRHLFDDLIDCKRILREVAILSRLSHECVVQVYDVLAPGASTSFDELYIVMEICDSDLKKLCRTDVTLTPLHINTLLYNLLIGVKYLHSAGIMHRDLKPANCLVNQDCSLKICDFGLSRAIGGEGRPLDIAALEEASKDAGEVLPTCMPAKRNLTGHVVTRWYRPPELILLQERYSAAIDLWSVGCIYAELIGMLDGFRLEDRGPLFPGTSCFPLSPDNRDNRHGGPRTRRNDQLNMIFNLLGTPSDSDVLELEREDARRYIQHFARRQGDGLQAKFPHAPAESLHILSGFLKFSPVTRWDVDQALRHPIFDDLRDPRREAAAVAGEVVVLSFEVERTLDEALLRKYFRSEMMRFGAEPDERQRQMGA